MCLCEVHERDEMKRAVNLGFDLIGVNNRDLRTLQVDVENALRFREDFPLNAVRVAESGIETARPSTGCAKRDITRSWWEKR